MPISDKTAIRNNIKDIILGHNDSNDGTIRKDTDTGLLPSRDSSSVLSSNIIDLQNSIGQALGSVDTEYNKPNQRDANLGLEKLIRIETHNSNILGDILKTLENPPESKELSETKHPGLKEFLKDDPESGINVRAPNIDIGIGPRGKGVPKSDKKADTTGKKGFFSRFPENVRRHAPKIAVGGFLGTAVIGGMSYLGGRDAIDSETNDRVQAIQDRIDSGEIPQKEGAQLIQNTIKSGDEDKNSDLMSTVGATTGGLVGGAIGGAVGSIAGPLGTAAGYAIGSSIGSMGGSYIAREHFPAITSFFGESKNKEAGMVASPEKRIEAVERMVKAGQITAEQGKKMIETIKKESIENSVPEKTMLEMGRDILLPGTDSTNSPLPFDSSRTDSINSPLSRESGIVPVESKSVYEKLVDGAKPNPDILPDHLRSSNYIRMNHELERVKEGNKATEAASSVNITNVNNVSGGNKETAPAFIPQPRRGSLSALDRYMDKVATY